MTSSGVENVTSIWVIKRSGVEEAGAIVGKYIPSLGIQSPSENGNGT